MRRSSSRFRPPQCVPAAQGKGRSVTLHPRLIPRQDDGIDLSILTSTLLPREAVEEPDEEWNYDLLLQHLSQEMQTEADEAKRRRQEAAAAGGAGVSPADGGASSGKRTSPTEAGDSEGGSFAAAAAAGAPGASVAIAGRRK